MIEAHSFERRPVVYFFLRRAELIRWTFRHKILHPEAKWYARALSLWLAIIGYETERCGVCGWKVGMVWWCDNPIMWVLVTGYSEGEGVLCMQCFDDRAHKQGIYLQWRVELLK